MVLMLWLSRTDRAPGLDHSRLATAMALENCAISVEQLPLRIFRASVRVLLEGLLTFRPNGVLVTGLYSPRLVLVSITFF
jgi:hypothetical protein